VRSFGVGLVFSEMIASRGVIEAFKNKAVRKKMHFFDISREHPPIAIQLVGYDPNIMAEAAKFNEQLGASIIDINMGCPVKKVVNTDSGAALMKNELLAGKIIESVVSAVGIPVTVKMRLGWDNSNLNAKNIAKIAENSGAKCVTVHGRTRSQFYEGTANWEAIREIKDSIRIPLIGNGDVLTPQDAHNLLHKSGASAVMVGRGTFGKPWLCLQIQNSFGSSELYEPHEPHEPLAEITDELVINTLKKHLELIIEEYGESQGIYLARKHIGWYSKGKQNSANFRQTVNASKSYAEIVKLIDCFWDV
jgi:tRNA-dihydrouridine synthase B